MFHEALYNWVLVYVVYLLFHHMRCVEFGGMIVLPPELIVRVVAIETACIAEHGQQPFPAALVGILLYGLDDLLGGELFEVAQDVGHAGRAVGLRHQMHVIGHQAPRIEFKPLVLLAVAQAFNEDVLVGHSGEYIRPAHRGEGDEIDPGRIVEFVAGAHGLALWEGKVGVAGLVARSQLSEAVSLPKAEDLACDVPHE